MKTISRYIMTLALLLTAVTGAWATDVYLVGNGNGNWLNGVAWDPGFTDNKMTEQNGVYSITFTNVAANSELQFKFSIDGTWYENYGCSSDDENELNKTLSNIELFGTNIMFGLTETADVTISFNLSELTYMISTKGMKVGDDASSGPEVAWNASTKTGTFSMPAFDVVLTPIYAKAAAFATTGTEPDVKTLLPAAAEGVIAGTDASLIAEGTGIVAFAGTSNEVKQGTLMYAIGTSATEAPAPTAFSATVPTAKNVADDGADVYVWYYIKGADTPDGQQATEDNTFNDTEPACLTVTVLTNKFNIQFNAANANTIEAGKATVTVGGTAATVTDGKLEGVKMGSEVKMTAAPGYKFKSVTAVKKAAVTYPLLSAATTDDVGKVVCADGHLHDAKTAVPDGCTAVGILSKVTETGHGLILALKDAAQQIWPTINGWTSVTTYASTTLKKVPDAARGSLTSYTTLGETTVSDWAVAQYEDYKAIFTNLGSTTAGNTAGKTYDGNVNAYITTGVGGTAMSGNYWSATPDGDGAWYFRNDYWTLSTLKRNRSVRPVLGF